MATVVNNLFKRCRLFNVVLGIVGNRGRTFMSRDLGIKLILTVLLRFGGIVIGFEFEIGGSEFGFGSRVCNNGVGEFSVGVGNCIIYFDLNLLTGSFLKKFNKIEVGYFKY
ncbi:uncharacterized protein B0T23DRAFT_399168 [Neurospora hispaniola]|uniref:Uncharacterized protein n=1 Tax=Neurospora hispaniola TaxID=588809 RepID=A0AAJ0I166_9PEZI|nr:hypothetical protein B0T23DRAFT_399168 [Neurospora hispaniola]